MQNYEPFSWVTPYKPNFCIILHHTSNHYIYIYPWFICCKYPYINWSTNSCFFWMKANHKLRTNRDLLTAQLKVQQEWALRCTCSSPPKPAHMDCSSVYLQASQLAGKTANSQDNSRKIDDWHLGNNLEMQTNEKIAHPGKTPKKKKLKYPLIHCESLSAIRASKHQGQNWVEWSHRLLRAWSSWPYPARVPQENVEQDILAPQFVQPHLIKHYLGESIKDHANHFVMYLLPNGLSAILTYNVRNVQLQVVAYLDKLVLLGYVWVGKRDDR